MRLLIDECLWPGLVQMARDAGYHESTCVRDRGLSGMKDHQLIRFAVDFDYTIVTHNAVEFRGENAGATDGLHAREPIHAGLICLVSPYPMTPVLQSELFGYALGELANLDDLINQAIEVVEDEAEEVTVVRYAIPVADMQCR